MTRAAGRPRGVVVGTVIATTIFLALYVRLWPFVSDDAFISLRYAQHAAAGEGFVYNAGERVEGYSNFLWTAFLALPFLGHLPPVPFLKVTLALAVLATAYVTARLGRVSGLTAEDGRDRGLAWVPAWLFLITPLVMERAAEGLETIPFTLLLVLAVTWTFEATGSERFPRPALVLVALAMMRPDGVSFAPLLFAVAAARGARRGYLVRFALLILVPWALFVAGRALYYGDWLPNTFHAKGGGERYMLMRGSRDLASFLQATGGWAWLIALPALGIRRTRRAAWPLLGAIALRGAFELWAGGAWIGRFRFMVPALPFLYLLAVGSVAALARTAYLRRLGLAFAAALLLAPAWLSYPTTESAALEYGRGLWQAHGAFGRAVERRTAPEALIAMDDSGLGPFLARRRNVDMLGLSDRHIARLPGAFAEKFDVGYVLGRRPDLIVLVSSVAQPQSPADLPLPGHAAMALDSTFMARYEWIRSYPMRRDYHLLVFRRRDSMAVPADF